MIPTTTGGGQIHTINGRREMWVPLPLPGGFVCAEPVDVPGGGRVFCGEPVESEPCSTHHPMEADQ